MKSSSWFGKRLGVIGAGNMAEALARGVVAAGLIPSAMIHAYDPLPERRALFASLGCAVFGSPDVPAGCDAVLLSVKPQTMRAALEEIRPFLKVGAVAISIAAGVPSRVLAPLLPPGVKLARVMPNTPLLVGLGMSCVAPCGGMDAGDTRMVLDLFASAGRAAEVAEEQLDAVTALSGSGPAYLFRFAEALEAGGRELGLSAELSRTLAVATLRGASEMLARGGDPADLRGRVTSPGGTTAAALRVFGERDFMGMVADAMRAAQRRGEELGREA